MFHSDGGGGKRPFYLAHGVFVYLAGGGVFVFTVFGNTLQV